MSRTNLLMLLGALLLAVVSAKVFSGKLPRPFESAAAGDAYTPMVLTDTMFPPNAPNMLDRQLRVQVLEDTNGILTCQQVAALPNASFEVKDPCCNFLWRERNTLWLRFGVTNHSRQERFLVEVINPFLDSLSFFQTNSAGQVLPSHPNDTTGTVFAFNHRPDTTHRNFIFPVRIAPDSSAWIYFRIRSEYPVHLRVLLFEHDERKHRQQWVVDILMTIFYTFCGLYLLFTGILIGVTKEHFHWYYFCYVLLTALFIPAHLGLGFMYFWPKAEHAYLQHIGPMALNNLRLIFGIQFFRLYFDLPKITPRFNRFVGGAILFFVFTLLLQIFHRTLGGWFVPLVFFPFFGLLMLFCGAMAVWVCYELLYKRRTRFSWLLIVVALHFIGVVTTSLQHLGYGSSGFDVANRLLAVFGIANTFFLSPLVIGAFFLEMVLVLYFATRRYLRLLDKNQRAQLRIAKTKEEGLNALLLGVENERRRIARDLHDSACVNLAAIRMKVDVLRETLPETAAAQMADIADDLELTYREVRDISHDLMSKALEKTDLLSALEDLTVRIRHAQPSLNLQLYANYDLDTVDKLAQINLYRIVQELLANVLRHAHASNATLQLLRDEGKLLLTVEDDGQGFDPQQIESDGIGLANIRTRVGVLRGHLHLESAPGKGTFVSIEIAEGNLTGV